MFIGETLAITAASRVRRNEGSTSLDAWDQWRLCLGGDDDGTGTGVVS